jgi:Predicted transcriptional regulators
MCADNVRRKPPFPAQGARLRKLRLDRGLSQNEVAGVVGIQQGDISRIESGGRTHVGNLTKLATLYDTTLDYIVRGMEPVARGERVGAA